MTTVNHQSSLRRLVEEYCDTQMHPSLPRFSVDGPFSTANVLQSAIADKPGCYAIYAESGQIRYIGMSMRVGRRSLQHFLPATQKIDFWNVAPANRIDLIAVTETWQAPSLESYLTVHSCTMREETWKDGRVSDALLMLNATDD